MFLCNRNNREERNQDDLLSNMIEIITDYNTKPLQGQLFYNLITMMIYRREAKTL